MICAKCGAEPCRCSPQSTPKERRRRPYWRPVFLEAFRTSGNVRASCQAAGVDRTAPYHEARKHPEFAEAWKQAEEDAIDMLEVAARQRGLRMSDTLLIFLLKAHRPEKYRDRIDIRMIDVRDEVSRLADELGLPDEEKRAAISEAERLVAGR